MNKNRKITISALFALSIALFLFFQSCSKDIYCIIGSGEVITKEFDVGSFARIDLQGMGDVIFTQSNETKIIVEAQKNILNELDIHASGSTLIIDFDRCVENYSSLNILVSNPELTGLMVSGSGSIRTNGKIDVDELDLRISGSGTINVDSLIANELDARISGYGGMYVAGLDTVPRQFIDVSGSGDIRTYDIPSKDTEVDISGSGSCRVNVINNLNVYISGSGSVIYRGDPNVNRKITGSGSVSKE